MSELAAVCDRLRQQVTQVDLATQELERRLMPVLRPAAPETSGGGSAPAPVMSPLAGTIDEASDSLLATTARIAGLLDRLATA